MTAPTAPFLFLDSTQDRSGRAGPSRLLSAPEKILTDLDGEFVELPGGSVVDPRAWLQDNSDGILAGFLAYEFAWDTLDVRAPRPSSSLPALWVGRFGDFDEGLPEFGGPGEFDGPRCRLSEADYQERVRRCIADIYAGELFEVNFTARFDGHWSGSVSAFYERLRRASTGAWFGLLQTDDFAIASVSPEEFIRVQDGRVTARPIKGTRRRSEDPQRDLAVAQELLASEKDRAENIMIVDLMRNDLTRVCRLGTVEAPGICELETFAGVHHLVSTVTGELREGLLPIEALLRCFPAGSVTGAPKLRAIELATEHEVDARGAYTGSFFVAHPDGWLRSNVLIRTATLFGAPGDYRVEYGAGGAVVAESDPVAEWEEALTKTAPLTRLARGSSG